MEKVLDLRKTVFELCSEHPELKEIMVGVGFKEISNPITLQTVGRVMTIPKGAAIKGIKLEVVVKTFQIHGFKVINGTESVSADASTKESRSRLLQSYVERLTKGEDIKSVRRDFVKNFRNVDAEEIAHAEQQLIRSGVKIHDVQRMCDVHSALFHGTTLEEVSSLQGIDNRCASMMREQGHPLNILYKENLEIESLINIIYTLLSEGAKPSTLSQQIEQLKQLTNHFSKKGDLLYTVLRSNYDVDAPFNVMWGVDDEIRDELHRLCKKPSDEAEWTERMQVVLTREREMIYKENNILFPLCANHFNDDEWQEIRTEIDGYRPCLLNEYPAWAKHTHSHPLYQVKRSEGKIQLLSGEMSVTQLEALLNTIPYEITFIDQDNTNSYFNQQLKDEKLFKRPLMALGRNVFDCHPPMVQPMVKQLLDSFQKGENNSFEIWGEKGGHDVLIRYLAVRDDDGNYLGTMECVQVMDFAKKHYKS